MLLPHPKTQAQTMETNHTSENLPALRFNFQGFLTALGFSAWIPRWCLGVQGTKSAICNKGMHAMVLCDLCFVICAL